MMISNLLFAFAWLVIRSSTIPSSLYAFYYMKPWVTIEPATIRLIATLSIPLPSILNLAWTYQIIMMGLKDLGLIKSRKVKKKQ